MGKKPFGQKNPFQFFTQLSLKQKGLLFCIFIVIFIIFFRGRSSPTLDQWSRDKAIRYHQSKSNFKYLTKKNLLRDTNFTSTGNDNSWRVIQECCDSITTFSKKHDQYFYVLQSYNKWDGLFQPIDIEKVSKEYKKEHRSISEQKYQMFHLDVDFINYNHGNDMSLIFRGLLQDNTTLDLDSRITITNKNPTWGFKSKREGARLGVQSLLSSKSDSELDLLTQRISLTLYSEKRFQYIIPYIVAYQTGTIVLRNASMTYGETNEFDKNTNQPTMVFGPKGSGFESYSKSIVVPTYVQETKRKVIPFFRKADYIVLDNDITIISQMDISRLARLAEMSKSWNGFISVVIYIKEEGQVKELEDLLIKPEYSSIKGNTDIHLVFKHKSDKSYPINYLRNVAIEHSLTDLVFSLDIDFITSPNSHSMMKKYLANSQYSRLNNSLFCVAPFEIDNYDMEHLDLFPKDQGELLQLMKKRKARPIHSEKITEAHRATDYSKWETATQIYSNVYELFWEPYCIFNRTTTPHYDPRFSGYGFDKVSHAHILNIFKHQFYTIPEVFIAHIDHPLSGWIQRTHEEVLNIWMNQYESMIDLYWKHNKTTIAGEDTFKNFREFNILNRDIPYPEVAILK